MGEVVEFRIRMCFEIDFKDMPKKLSDEFEKLLMQLKTKKLKKSAKKGLMRIDVEKVE